MMELSKIDKDTYMEFIGKQFTRGKKKLGLELIEYILNFTHRHTYYVQAFCNFVYGLRKSPLTIPQFKMADQEFLMEKRVFYEEIPNRLTKQQFRCVRAIAKEEKVKSTTSEKFLSTAGIKNASRMQCIIKSLAQKQFIIKEGKQYQLNDVFLEHYLKLVF